MNINIDKKPELPKFQPIEISLTVKIESMEEFASLVEDHALLEGDSGDLTNSGGEPYSEHTAKIVKDILSAVAPRT